MGCVFFALIASATALGNFTDSPQNLTSFFRKSRAVDAFGNDLQPGIPRTEQMTWLEAVENSASPLHANSAIPIIPFGVRKLLMYGIYGGRIYLTSDGENWSTLSSASLPFLVNCWLLANGNILGATVNGQSCVIKISTDNGSTWQDTKLGTQSPFKLGVAANGITAYLQDSSIAESKSGTLMMGEYHLTPGTTGYACRLFRSTDHGISWSNVYSFPIPIPDPTVNSHWHTLAKQEALGVWIGISGDGPNRRIFASTDDGLTWKPTTAFDFGLFQPVGLLDYGDSNKLLFGSDDCRMIGTLQVSRQGNTVAITQGWDGDSWNHPYYWPLYRDSQGMLYGIGSNYMDSDGKRQTPIVASSGAMNASGSMDWTAIGKFADGSTYSKRIAGSLNGRIHAKGILPGSINAHVSFPQVSAQTFEGIRVDPDGVNLLNTDDSSDFESGVQGLTVANGAVTINKAKEVKAWHGSYYAKITGLSSSWKVEQLVGLIRSSSIQSVPGATYYAKFHVRSPYPGTMCACQLYSNATQSAVGTRVQLGCDTTWREVDMPGYQASQNDTDGLSIQFSFYNYRSPGQIEYDLDGLQMSLTPGTWCPAGFISGHSHDLITDTFDSPATWTHRFLFLPQVISTQIVGTYPLVVHKATNINPVLVSMASPHGWTDGQLITFTKAAGNTSFNGSYFVKISGNSATTAQLYKDSALSSGVGGNGTYVNDSGKTSATSTYFISTYYLDDRNYVEIFFNTLDQTINMRRTVAGVAQPPVKSSPTYFCKNMQLECTVTSTSTTLSLSIRCGDDLIRVADLPFPALNSAKLRWQTGGQSFGLQLPMKIGYRQVR